MTEIRSHVEDQRQEPYLIPGVLLTAIGVTVLNNVPWTLQYSDGSGCCVVEFRRVSDGSIPVLKPLNCSSTDE